jgi:myxalamid-type polyketide synthase MxaB
VAAAAQIAPLTGVIHAAGQLDDGVLATLPWSRFAAVLAPKTLGAWNLHHASLGHALDFFVLYSSAAAVLGPTAQGNYAAANAFLDALAAYRRGLGLPALSIDWGAWSGIGMVARMNDGSSGGGKPDQLSRRGMSRIAPAEGKAILAYLFDHPLAPPLAQVMVASINWELFLARYGRQPLFEHFFLAAQQKILNAELLGLNSNSFPHLKNSPLNLAGLPPGEQRMVIMEMVKGEVARVLGLDSAQAVEEDVGLFEMGMDSLTAVELRNALQTAVGMSLPTTLLFKYSTVQALARFFADESPEWYKRGSPEVDKRDIQPEEEGEAVAEPVLKIQNSPSQISVEAMSEAELMAMIDAELDGL